MDELQAFELYRSGRHPFLVKDLSRWQWCLHCGRVFERVEGRLDGDGLICCPFPDCDGTLIDFVNCQEDGGGVPIKPG